MYAFGAKGEGCRAHSVSSLLMGWGVVSYLRRQLRSRGLCRPHGHPLLSRLAPAHVHAQPRVLDRTSFSLGVICAGSLSCHAAHLRALTL